MTDEFNLDSSVKACCPKCRREVLARIVYGYPLLQDFPPQSIYGGDECPLGSPTHFCVQCEVAWSLAGCPALHFGFPHNCYFCDSQLAASDKLTYSMEFEEWIACDSSTFKLTDDIFSRSLYPVCKQCRAGIRANLDELAAQEGQEDRQRTIAYRLALGGFLLCVLLFVYATLTKK